MRTLSDIQEPLNEHMLFRIIFEHFRKWNITKRELQQIMDWGNTEMKNRLKSGNCPLYFKTKPCKQGEVRFHVLDVVKWYLKEV